MQKATSPSTSENTGSTARATPADAIRATREQAGLSSGASVITQTSVVLRSSSPAPIRLLRHRDDRLCGRGRRARVGLDPGEHRPVLSDHVTERVHHRQRGDPVAEAGTGGRVADAGRGRVLAPRDLAHRGPGSGADPAALRHPRRRRLAGRVTGRGVGPRRGIARREVVDHRRRDDRHQAAGGRVAAALLLAASASRRRPPPGRRRCPRSASPRSPRRSRRAARSRRSRAYPGRRRARRPRPAPPAARSPPCSL